MVSTGWFLTVSSCAHAESVSSVNWLMPWQQLFPTTACLGHFLKKLLQAWWYIITTVDYSTKSIVFHLFRFLCVKCSVWFFIRQKWKRHQSLLSVALTLGLWTLWCIHLFLFFFLSPRCDLECIWLLIWILSWLRCIIKINASRLGSSSGWWDTWEDTDYGTEKG